MQRFFESAANAHNASLEAAAGFGDAYLSAVERLAQLCIEANRAACENSTEMALFCLDKTLAHNNATLWSSSFQSDIERFFPAPPEKP